LIVSKPDGFWPGKTEREGGEDMKKRWFFGLIICVALLTLIPTIVIADTFSFQRTEGIDIAILTPEEFQATFGDNPDIPLTHSEIVEYATWLFPPLESGLVASEVQSGSAVSGTEIPPKKGTP